jgi:hypothetical protein
MSSINPDGLRADIIVEARSSAKNHLIQMSHASYRSADSLANIFGLEVGMFLLSIHGIGQPLAGQESVFTPTEETALNLALLDCDDDARQAIERQAGFRKISVGQYMAALVREGLAADEAESIFIPGTGTVIGRRDRFGKIWKSVRLAHPEVNGEGGKP